MSAASIPKSTPLQRRRSLIEQISHRLDKPITIIEYDIIWPEQFSIVHQRIQQALGNRVLAIEHIGSTSVPGLPAKAVIDVDIIIADPTQEADYVPALEAAGFQFVFREPFWYDHRFFGLEEPYANVHVFAPDCPEHLRHVAFRDWLRECAEDRLLYASVKREAAEVTCQDGGTVMDYNDRKAFVIRDILSRVDSKTAGLMDR
ncbi:hypothetical protein TMatcc_006514 [Talaromyces marneffei ATCC 18224]|uniref:GrpB domain protein n=2 Tax=Talaromyces marneffei TaxID=37727 RepID=B6QAD6_TALMQ|nr:uncharacterized protein EYB26_002548 [Talaromyces marneffei]EEA25263.1 GrpB domain protein [Talaromyces marneffei ATCC 18224]EEA25264.1 GrpB domain protein [Talaromyces marneffei ATCC 18224]KAE8553994.1 hypothetical protein EYB25_002532 [Talaromyces marneffei]QGA14892.1 hypothetical protein EYB26_002548 [Talaromyces marneffei]